MVIMTVVLDGEEKNLPEVEVPVEVVWRIVPQDMSTMVIVVLMVLKQT